MQPGVTLVPRRRSRLHGMHMVCVSSLVFVAYATTLVSAAAAQTGAPGPELPLVLLVPERSGAPAPQLDDLNVRLKTTLREALTRSGRFQVHTFIPGENLIKRALNEHLIAADDLVEPHKAEGLQRIARAIGARFILKYSVALDRVEARTAMQYMDNPNQKDWVVLADERMAVPLLIGRRRLKPDDIVNLTVDSITARIGVPTHLAGNLQRMPGTRVFGNTEPAPKKGRDAGRKADTKVAQAAERAHDIPPADLNPTPATDAAGRRDTSKPTKTGRGNRTQAPETRKPRIDPGPPVFTNEADPARGILPAQPTVAPPPVVPRPDYAAQALRYRQTGDLSNAVTALRRAINDRPLDVPLRRQLIAAYQARQMPEAAHAEALRALRLDPANSNLYRLYGEVLLSEGDLPGALQAFRDGIRIDPTDIACQVALGDAQLADGHFNLALDAYNAAAQSDSKSPLPHRRIARALAARAATDGDQYQSSLAELQKARDLTPPTDSTSYVEDYVAIMRIIDSRIHELLEELQSANQARVQLKRTQPELLRQIADLKQRSTALADYLDKLPPAIGSDVTQAHYVQANALLLQAVGFFRDLVEKGDDHFGDAMKSGQVQAQRELVTAGQRLTGSKAPDKTRAQ